MADRYTRFGTVPTFGQVEELALEQARRERCDSREAAMMNTPAERTTRDWRLFVLFCVLGAGFIVSATLDLVGLVELEPGTRLSASLPACWCLRWPHYS